MNRMLALLTAATAMVFTAQVGHAADVAKPAAPAPVVVKVVPYSWSGIYFGAQGGLAGLRTQWRDAGAYTFPGAIQGIGWEVGPEVGANYQFSTIPLVVGIEGDWSWTNAKVQIPVGVNPTPPTATACTHAVPCTESLPWIATIRGRVGLATDKLLIYGTGGVAFAQFSPRNGAVAGFSNYTDTGWVAGLGAELAFGDQVGLSNNWSAKVEWLFADFGSSPSFGPGGTVHAFPHSVQLLRVGINYKFPSIL